MKGVQSILSKTIKANKNNIVTLLFIIRISKIKNWAMYAIGNNAEREFFSYIVGEISLEATLIISIKIGNANKIWPKNLFL